MSVKRCCARGVLLNAVFKPQLYYTPTSVRTATVEKTDVDQTVVENLDCFTYERTKYTTTIIMVEDKSRTSGRARSDTTKRLKTASHTELRSG